MSEESSIVPFDSAQGKLALTLAKATVGKQDDIVSDEFFREEIGCCPRAVYIFVICLEHSSL